MTGGQARGSVMNLMKSRNLLIQRMTDEDRERLSPYFTEERLDFKQILLEQAKPVVDV